MSRKAWAWVRFVAPAGVLAVLVWRLGTGPFLHGLSRVNGAALAEAGGLVALTTVLCAWRWMIVARGLGVELSLPTAVAAYYRALFLNVALPGGIVGDVHRGISQGRDVNSVGTGLRAVAWERFAGVVVQLVLTVGVLLALPSPVHSLVPLLAVTGAALVGGVVLVARWRVGGAQSVWTRVRSALGGDIRLARRSWAGVALLSALSVAGHAAVFVLAARTAGTTAPLLKILPIALIVMWAGVLPSIGGWGPREGITAWAFGAAGVGAGLGLATAVAYGVMILVACLPGAGVLVVAWFRGTLGRNPRKLPLREGPVRA